MNDNINEIECNNPSLEQTLNRSIGIRLIVSGDLLFTIPITNPFPPKRSNLSERQEIKVFSTTSGRRMTRYLRECEADYTRMITLTYGKTGGRDGRESKADIHLFFKTLERSEYWKENSSVFWFMEFQKRGVIHYHIFVTDYIPMDWLAKVWNNIVYRNTDLITVRQEKECHLKAGTRIETIRKGRGGVISYARKYAKKQEQKVIPENFQNAGRFWGIRGNRVRDKAASVVVFQEHLVNPILKETAKSVLKAVETFKTIANIKLFESYDEELISNQLSIYKINAKFVKSMVSLFDYFNNIVNPEHPISSSP